MIPYATIQMGKDSEAIESHAEEGRDYSTSYLQGYVSCYEENGSKLWRFLVGRSTKVEGYKRVLEERTLPDGSIKTN